MPRRSLRIAEKNSPNNRYGVCLPYGLDFHPQVDKQTYDLETHRFETDEISYLNNECEKSCLEQKHTRTESSNGLFNVTVFIIVIGIISYLSIYSDVSNRLLFHRWRDLRNWYTEKRDDSWPSQMSVAEVIEKDESKESDLDKLVEKAIEQEIKSISVAPEQSSKSFKSFIDKQCKLQPPGKPAELALRPPSPVYYADTVPDYALQSSGAEILEVDGENYGEAHFKLSLFGFGFLLIPYNLGNVERRNGPSSILQPWNYPGECWALKGTQGSVRIRLARLIQVKAVTLEHITAEISPDLNINSAPRSFSIIGVEQHGSIVIKRHLGSFEYITTGPPIQTFLITPSGLLEAYPHQMIEFKIHSNHGSAEYTCVYRLRVHGQLNDIQ